MRMPLMKLAVAAASVASFVLLASTAGVCALDSPEASTSEPETSASPQVSTGTADEPQAPAEEEAGEEETEAVLPVYVALHPNINAFQAFSDGGWDGNWYVGFNTCWIVKLPKPPEGSYSRAFLGARLGRAKTRPRPGGALWDKDAIPGKIHIGISSYPAFSPSQTFFLADTKDIPVEPDYENPSLGVGHAEWFWTEIPLKLVNMDGPIYLAAWSTTESLVTASSAPILGAAMDPRSQKEPAAWLNSNILGVPPRGTSSSVGVPVSFYLPSLVLKLVPPNREEVVVRALSVSSRDETRFDLRFSVYGENVEMAWVEASPDGMGWERISPYLRQPPYMFEVPAGAFGKSYAAAEEISWRGVAQDVLGNLGMSEPLQTAFSPGQPK